MYDHKFAAEGYKVLHHDIQFVGELFITKDLFNPRLNDGMLVIHNIKIITV